MSMTGSAPTTGLPVVGADSVTFVHLYRGAPAIGLCRFSGRIHYFALDRRSPEPGPPLLYPLTEEEIEREELLQTLFELHVGTHRSPGLPSLEREIPLEAYDRYSEAVAEAFPGMDVYTREYATREPVAVLEAG